MPARSDSPVFSCQLENLETAASRSIFPVALTMCPSYADGETPNVTTAVHSVLDAISADVTSSWPPSRGSRVLVKPNLLKAHALTCTHPQVVREVCLWLLDRGVKVTVADSPGFGTAAGVAQSIGLAEALQPLGLTVQSLDCPVKIPVGFGINDEIFAPAKGLAGLFARPGHWGVSRLALESDLIVSLPRVKTHAMMGMTLAVKNLFGCISGLGKAFAHSAQGHQPGLFERCVVDILQALPPVAAVADGITAMHVTGPSSGKPFALGLIGASPNAVALDEAIYDMLNAQTAVTPIRAEIQRRKLAGAFAEDIHFCLEKPDAFPTGGFIIPSELQDVSFRPHRLAISTCRRIWKGICN